MSSVLTVSRYPEDSTGIASSNRITGEIKTTSTRTIRVVVPNYAYFFANEELKVYDVTNGNRLLTLGVDYRLGMFSKEAFTKFGLNAAALIIIVNTSVSNTLRLDYQTVGGDYAADVTDIQALVDLVLNDNRNIAFYDIIDRPPGYNPNEHYHILDDIVGFDRLVMALERLAQTMMIGATPAFQSIVEIINDRMLPTATEQEVIDGAAVNKLVTMDRLLLAAKSLNFNTMTWTIPNKYLYNGTTLEFIVNSTNLDDRVMLYWSIDHITTSDADFIMSRGSMQFLDQKASAVIQVKGNDSRTPESEETFRIVIRSGSATGTIIAKSPILTIAEFTGLLSDNQAAMTSCCFFTPRVRKNAATLSLLGE